MGNSKIEWTDKTWNPVTGCSRISEGCENCYAERMAKRLYAMGQSNYRNAFEVTEHPYMLEHPFHWKKPQKIFVCSMGDLFHEKVSLSYIQKVFDVMRRAEWHRFQVLTKRSERLAELDKHLEWAPNIWMGVSVETDRYCTRIDDLRKTHAFMKFLSIEPLLGPLPNLGLDGIDWVIAGCESGPHRRETRWGWAWELKEQCELAATPFFLKQMERDGAIEKMPKLDGKVWNQFPGVSG